MSVQLQVIIVMLKQHVPTQMVVSLALVMRDTVAMESTVTVNMNHSMT